MKGAYVSNDLGATWSPSNTGMENQWVMSFEKDGSYLYAGTLGSGVFRSSDQGVTWSPANTGFATAAAYCLLNAGGYLWAGTIGTGVWKSPDQGSTWMNANGGALGSSFIFAMVFRGQRLEVEADNYLFYTDDGGQEWYVDQGSTAFYCSHGATLDQQWCN